MQKILILLSALLLTNCSYLKSQKDLAHPQFSAVEVDNGRVIKQNMESVPLRKQYADGSFSTTTSGFQNVARVLAPSFNNSFGDIQSTAVVLKNNLAYVSYNTSGNEVGGAVDIIDVSDSHNPVILKTFISDVYEFSDLAIKDNYLYAAGYKKDVGAVLAVINVLNNDLVVEDIISLQGIYATDLDLLNNRLIVVTGTVGGVSEFNVSDSSTPVLVSFKPLDNGLSLAQSSWFDFYLYGNNRTVLDSNQLPSYNSVYSSPAVNTYSNQISNQTSEAPSRIKLKNSLIYVLNSTSHSLKLLDASFVGRDQSELRPVFEFPVVGTANGFDVDQQKAYLALGEKGVKVVGVNVSSGTDLGDLSFSDQGSANNIWIKNSSNAKIMFIAYGRQGTRILTEQRTFNNSNKIRVMARGMGSSSTQAQLQLKVNNVVVENQKNISDSGMTVYEWTYSRPLNNNDKVEVFFINDNNSTNPNTDINLYVHYLWVNDLFCYQSPLNTKGSLSDFGLYLTGQGIRINQGVCESLYSQVSTYCPTGSHSCETGCTPDERPCSVGGSTGVEHWTNGSWSGTCEINHCADGYYLENGQCIARVCTPNSTQSCVVSNGSGTKTCNTYGSGYGSCVVNSCNSGYHLENGSCVTNQVTCSNNHGTGVSTWNGSSWSSCVVDTCEAGYSLVNGSCVVKVCTPNSTTTCSVLNLMGTKTCNSSGTAYGNCVTGTTCASGYYFLGGICIQQTCNPNSSTSCPVTNGTGTKTCTSTGSCYGSCTPTGCNSGYYLNNGSCVPQTCTPNSSEECSVNHVMGTHQCTSTGSAWGTCVTNGTCESGYYMDAGVCKPQVCNPNQTYSCNENCASGTKVCNSTGSGFGSCTPTTCNSGYYLENGVCKPQVCSPNSSTQCSENNGSGTKTCNNTGSSYGTCVISTCNSGYYLENGVCKPQTCNPNSTVQCVNNHFIGTSTCSANGSSYGTCVPGTTCESGYYLDGGVCKPQTCTPNSTMQCSANNGSGIKTCASNGSSYGTCVISTCDSGYYMDGGVCKPQVCNPNQTYSCNENCATGTKVCNTTGSGFGSCTPVTCQNGYYLNNGICTPQVCSPNSTSSCSVNNGTGSQTCSSNGSAWGTCVVNTCNSGYYLNNGVCVPQTCTPNSTQSCSVNNFAGSQTCSSNGSTWGSCVVTPNCVAGYYLDNGVCKPQTCIPGSTHSCPISNGTGSQICSSNGSGYGSCSPTGCNNGYYLNGSVCSPQLCTPNSSQSCVDSNHLVGTQYCNSSGSAWGSCNTNVSCSCESGYHLENGSCVPNVCTPNSTTSCAIDNGTGIKTCNSSGSAYGSCVLNSCNSGYHLSNGACVIDQCTEEERTVSSVHDDDDKNWNKDKDDYDKDKDSKDKEENGKSSRKKTGWKNGKSKHKGSENRKKHNGWNEHKDSDRD